MEKQALGYKSNKMLFLFLLLFIIDFALVIFILYEYFKDKELLILICDILFAVILIPFGYNVFKTILKPFVIIEYDDKGLYINYSKKDVLFIQFKDIFEVDKINLKAKYKEYKSGFIIIKTKEKKYKIGILQNVNEVYKFISKRISWRENITTYIKSEHLK